MKRFLFLFLLLVPTLCFSQVSDTEPVTVGFVPNGNHVSMIDLSLGKVIYRLYTGQSPFGATISPDKKYVWVVNTGSLRTTIVDLTKRSGFAKVEVSNVIEALWPVTFDPTGMTAYGISLGDSSLVEIDCTSFLVKSTKKVSEQSLVRDIALTPDKKKLYSVLGSAFRDEGLRGSVTVSDPLTGKEIKKISGGTAFRAIELSNDGKFLFALDSGSSEVAVIDTGTDQIVKKFALGASPVSFFLSPDMSKLVVTCGGEVQLYGLELKKKVSVRPILKARFEGFCEFGAFSPNGETICVGDRDGKRVVVLSSKDLSTTSTIPLIGTPATIELVEMLSRDRLAIARWSSSNRQSAKNVVNRLRNRGSKFKDAKFIATIFEIEEDKEGAVVRKTVTMYFSAPFLSRIEVRAGEVIVGKESKEKILKDGVVTERPRSNLWYIPFGMVNVQEATFISHLTAESGEEGRVSIALDVMHGKEEMGINFIVLGAADGDSLSSQFWVNSDSWLPAKLVERDPQTSTFTETQFLDYHYVANRYWFPHKIDTYVNGRLVRSLLIEKVSLDQGIDPSLFEL